MDAAKLLVRNLKILRLRHDLTQEEFAEAAGVDPKYYQHIEAGRRSRVRIDTLDRLAGAVFLNAGELILPQLPETTKVRGRTAARKAQPNRIRREKNGRQDQEYRPLEVGSPERLKRRSAATRAAKP